MIFERYPWDEFRTDFRKILEFDSQRDVGTESPDQYVRALQPLLSSPEAASTESIRRGQVAFCCHLYLGRNLAELKALIPVQRIDGSDIFPTPIIYGLWNCFGNLEPEEMNLGISPSEFVSRYIPPAS